MTLRMTFGSASPCRLGERHPAHAGGRLGFRRRARDIDRLLQRKMREAVLDHAGQLRHFNFSGACASASASSNSCVQAGRRHFGHAAEQTLCWAACGSAHARRRA